MNIELTNNEFSTLREIFYDHGSDCPSVCYEDFQALGEKLGILKPIPVLTEEELKRRKEFSKLMSPILEASNKVLEQLIKDFSKPNSLLIGFGSKSWPIGTKIAIRLPNDYTVTK